MAKDSIKLESLRKVKPLNFSLAQENELIFIRELEQAACPCKLEIVRDDLYYQTELVLNYGGRILKAQVDDANLAKYSTLELRAELLRIVSDMSRKLYNNVNEANIVDGFKREDEIRKKETMSVRTAPSAAIGIQSRPKCPIDSSDMRYQPHLGYFTCMKEDCKYIIRPASDADKEPIKVGEGEVQAAILVDPNDPNILPRLMLVQGSVAVDITDLLTINLAAFVDSQIRSRIIKIGSYIGSKDLVEFSFKAKAVAHGADLSD